MALRFPDKAITFAVAVIMETYRKIPLVIGALFKRGYSEARVAKFMGGNVLKVMDAVQAG